MLELTKTAQAKKEELRKEQQENKVSTEKAKEDKQLKDLFDDGEKFVVWLKTLKPYYYKINIPGFDSCGFCFLGGYKSEHTMRRDRKMLIEHYIIFLRTAFEKLHDQFEKRKKTIYDSRREKKTTSHPRNYSQDRVFPGSGTVINGCCGGTNEHTKYCKAGCTYEVPLDTNELETLRNRQEQEVNEIKKDFEPQVIALHAHMEGFIETMLKENPDTDAMLIVVRVAMIAGADTFREFGGRQKVLERLRTTVVNKIEKRLSTDENLDEAGIQEIERILEEVQKAVGRQIK